MQTKGGKINVPIKAGHRIPFNILEHFHKLAKLEENFGQLVKLIPLEEILNDISHWNDWPLMHLVLNTIDNLHMRLRLASVIIFEGFRNISQSNWSQLLQIDGTPDLVRKIPQFAANATLEFKYILHLNLGNLIHIFLKKCTPDIIPRLKFEIPDVLGMIMTIAMTTGVEEIDDCIALLITKFKVDIMHLRLFERAALKVRRVCTKEQIEKLANKIDLPEKIQQILLMRLVIHFSCTGTLSIACNTFE